MLLAYCPSICSREHTQFLWGITCVNTCSILDKWFSNLSTAKRLFYPVKPPTATVTQRIQHLVKWWQGCPKGFANLCLFASFPCLMVTDTQVRISCCLWRELCCGTSIGMRWGVCILLILSRGRCSVSGHFWTLYKVSRMSYTLVSATTRWMGLCKRPTSSGPRRERSGAFNPRCSANSSSSEKSLRSDSWSD